MLDIHSLFVVQAKNGSLFPSAAITLYVTYLGYTALQSEPHNYECNGIGHRYTAASATTLALGMLLTLLSVVYSALRAGSNTQTFLTSSAPSTPTARDVEQALLDQGTSAGLDGAPDTQTMTAGAPFTGPSAIALHNGRHTWLLPGTDGACWR